MMTPYEKARGGGGDPVWRGSGIARFHRVPFTANNAVDARYVQRNLPGGLETSGLWNYARYSTKTSASLGDLHGVGLRDALDIDAASAVSKSTATSNSFWQPLVKRHTRKHPQLAMKITESRFSGNKEKGTHGRPRFEYVPRSRESRICELTAKITETRIAKPRRSMKTGE
eukprot:GEMP01019905.1.p1 GENE.GEMP01019905.1~~GEMP01019905.1.p1  ORF type:complete len:171 (+),score=25.48 GEMP01019905.1:368-880(+)